MENELSQEKLELLGKLAEILLQIPEGSLCDLANQCPKGSECLSNCPAGEPGLVNVIEALKEVARG